MDNGNRINFQLTTFSWAPDSSLFGYHPEGKVCLHIFKVPLGQWIVHYWTQPIPSFKVDHEERFPGHLELKEIMQLAQVSALGMVSEVPY